MTKFLLIPSFPHILPAFTALFLTGCATTGGGADQAEVRPAADALAARINACYASSQSSGAMKTADGTAVSDTTSSTVTYSGARISSNGTLSFIQTEQISKRSQFPTFVHHDQNSVTISSSVPLPKVNNIYIQEWNGFTPGTSNVQVSQHASSTTATLRTKSRYNVSLGCDGWDTVRNKTTHAGTNLTGQPYSTTSTSKDPYATVASFATRTEAAAFARDFQSLVTKYRKGQAPTFQN